MNSQWLSTYSSWGVIKGLRKCPFLHSVQSYYHVKLSRFKCIIWDIKEGDEEIIIIKERDGHTTKWDWSRSADRWWSQACLECILLHHWEEVSTRIHKKTTLWSCLCLIQHTNYAHCANISLTLISYMQLFMRFGLPRVITSDQGSEHWVDGHAWNWSLTHNAISPTGRNFYASAI